jgi:hypothetical protein
MRVRSVVLPLFVLLAARPVLAQEWIIFRQSFRVSRRGRKPGRYRPFYVNRLPRAARWAEAVMEVCMRWLGKLFGAGLVVATLGMALLFAQSRASGQPPKSLDPIFGKWLMDQTRSVNNRGGDHATFPTQHVRILAPEGKGVRNILANTPTSSPQYSYSAPFDGKDHADPRFPDRDQTLAHWRLGPDLIVRQQKTDGKTSEWVIYTVSADGNVFTSISWAPSRPDLQDVQVFTREN